MPKLTETAQLQEQGVIVLPGVFPKRVLTSLKKSAEACFAAVEAGRAESLGTAHKFSPFSYSMLLPALLEFGAGSPEELLAPIHAAGLDGLGLCDVNQAWVRKRYAPIHARRHYRPNSWHQDGGLGAIFGVEADSSMPLTPL